MKGNTIEIRTEQSSESTADITVDTFLTSQKLSEEKEHRFIMTGSTSEDRDRTTLGLPKSPRGRVPEVRIFRPTIVETSQRSRSPSPFVRCNSREDSQCGGDSGITYASSVYLHSSQNNDASSSTQGSQVDDAEEVMIHRYLTEKAKVRAAEAYNSDLQMTVAVLDKKLEESLNEAEKAKIAADAKEEQYEKMTDTLQKTIRDLQDQFSKHSMDTGTQITAIREDADKQVKIIREIGESNLESVRKELEQLQASHGTLQKLLDEKKAELSEQNRMMEETDKKYQEINNQFMRQKESVENLQAELHEIKTSAEKEEEAVNDLRSANDNVNEMLAFQNEKCEELSSELKLMSQQYIESLEKLEFKCTENEKLIIALDEAEKNLSEEKKNNASISVQLEDMARGFIDIDDLLEKESTKTNEFTSVVIALKEAVEMERKKTSKLTDELAEAQRCLKIKSDETFKLHDLTTDMSAQLSAEKNSLADAISEVINLTKSGESKQALIEKYEEELKLEKGNSADLAHNLDDLNEKFALLSKEAESSADGQGRATMLSDQLKEKSEACDLLQSELAEERRINEESDSRKSMQIETLTSTVAKLESDVALLQETADSKQVELDDIGTLREKLEEDLELKVSELSNLRHEYEDLKEENEEKIKEQDEKNASLTAELESLETKHSSLFDNLVETETALSTTRETLLLLNKKLRDKDEEFKQIENKLKEEIEKGIKCLKQEQEKSLTLSTELIEINNKYNAVNSTLISAEARVVEMENTTRDLQKALSGKENECELLTKSLEKEKNAPHQRKLKVAKRMIQAEKDRHRAILQEVEAKDIIITRIEKQAEGLKGELENTKEEFKEEKSKKVTYAGLALQELRNELEEERKTLKKEKEELRSLLKSERAKTRSYALRLKAVEGKSIDNEAYEVSNALQKQFEDGEEIRKLTEANDKLEATIEESRRTEERLKGQLSRVMRELKNISVSMDTMKKYCEGLEEEKNFLKIRLQNTESGRRTKDFLHTLEGRDDSDESSDAETLGDSEKSLSDFSLALVPPPRQTHREFLRKRTKLLKTMKESEKEDIEMTVDTDILYD